MRLGPFEFTPSRGNIFAGVVAVLALAFLIYLPIGSITLWHSLQNHRHTEHDAALPHSGQTVHDGAMGFTLGAAACGRSSIGALKPAHGQYCTVEVTARNGGPAPMTFAAMAQRATGSGGAFYLPDPAADAALNRVRDAIDPADLTGSLGGDVTAPLPGKLAAEPQLAAIPPGGSLTTTLVYDVPLGFALTELELHRSVYSTGVHVLAGN